MKKGAERINKVKIDSLKRLIKLINSGQRKKLVTPGLKKVIQLLILSTFKI